MATLPREMDGRPDSASSTSSRHSAMKLPPIENETTTSDSLTDINQIKKSVTFPENNPLPSIGAGGDSLTNDKDGDLASEHSDEDHSLTGGVDDGGGNESGSEGSSELEEDEESDEDISSNGSSAALDSPGEGRTHSRAVRGYRSEMSSATDIPPEGLGERPVSFSPHSDSNRTPSPAIRERSRRKNFDGREVVFVTLDTQTDWEWVYKVSQNKRAKQIAPRVTDLTPELTIETGDTASIATPIGVADSHGKTDGTTTTSFDDKTTDTTPYPAPYSDEYGIPLLELSSDTDDSSDEGSNRKTHEERNLMPTVGPPQILQYTRESEREDTIVEFPDGQFPGDDETMDASQVGMTDSDGNLYSMFSGQCEFCGNTIKAIPTLDQQNNDTPENNYCCNAYAEFIQFTMTATRMLENEVKDNQKIIDVKVHAHHGNKQARRAAKELAVQRLRDRELQRKQQEATGLQQANFYASGSKKAQEGAGTGAASAPKPSLAAPSFPTTMVARQMKTINYSLASMRCLEEGWTIRPPSPLISEEPEEVFEAEPIKLMNSLQSKGLPFVEKFYDSGQKFLTIFADGTGNVFYPSGNVAIVITAAEKKNQFIYIVCDDLPDEHILAVFEPNGYGCCYHLNGVIRVFLDQLGGIELEASGAKKRRWKWIDMENHVHAPPLQPICFALTKYIGIRIMNQDNIAITFSCKKCSCRFNVGSRLKLLSFENLPQPELDDDQIFLEERKNHVQAVLDKVSNLLKFPKSPKIDKILPPIHITSKIHRTEKLKKARAKQIAVHSAQPSKSKKILPVISVN